MGSWPQTWLFMARKKGAVNSAIKTLQKARKTRHADNKTTDIGTYKHTGRYRIFRSFLLAYCIQNLHNFGQIKKKGVTDPRDFDSGLNIPFRHASNPFSNGFSN